MSQRERLFYIQDSRTYCGNSAVWWRPNGQGYTSNLDDAWQVPESRARAICATRDTDKMWPCEEVYRRAAKHFDMQRFKEIEPVACHSQASHEQTDKA